MTHRVHNTHRHRQRKGVATFIVVVLLSITLVVAYSVMRTQSVSVKIQQNSVRKIAARQAAATGMIIALKKMHLSDEWQGVDTTIAGKLGQYETYKVTYTTGDPSIPANDSNSPYRVTLLSTGYVADSNTPTSISTHQVRTVVRLIPLALASEPDNWNTIKDYTVCQNGWAYDYSTLSPPCRIEGKVYLPLFMTFGNMSCDSSNIVAQRYLVDLNRIRKAGRPDWRPLTGPIEMIYIGSDLTYVDQANFIGSSLGITASITKPYFNTEITHPGAMASYKLYPGGKTYTAELLDQIHQDQTLQADPEKNPIGLFYCNTDVTLKNNVTVRGTILTSGLGKLRLYGDNVLLEPANLPAIEDTSSPYDGLPVRLPTTITNSDIEIYSGTRATINGLVTSWGSFNVLQSDQDRIDITVNGQVFTKLLRVYPRTNWKETDQWWKAGYEEFMDQLNKDGGEPYFPLWLATQKDLDPTPRIVIKPDTVKAYYHWKNRNDPIYVPRANDTGLRWDLLEWTENPN